MNKEITVYLRGLDVNCIGKYDFTSNNLKILKGSVIRKKVSQQFKYNDKRLAQIKKSCEEKETSYVLNEDINFQTPTAAAKFSLGYEVNGPLYWKSDERIKLKEIISNVKK